MKINKTIKFLLLSILITIFLSSCINVEYKITINKDNSCDVQYKALVNSMLIGFMQQNDNSNIFADMTQSAQNEGYTVSNITEDDKTGIKAVKHIDNLEKALAQGDPFGEISAQFPIKPGKDLKIKKTFFKTEYTLNTDIDLTSITPENEGSNDWSNSITESMVQSMRFRFILGLPKESNTNNASSNEDNKKLLIWDLIPGQHNAVKADLSIPNTTNFVILGSIGFIIIITIIILVIINIKRKKSHITTALT